MRSFSETINRLSAQVKQPDWSGPVGKTLNDLRDFGTNPGALTAKIHLPEQQADHLALVVVLHGCTQAAEGYNVGSGWSQMADRHGFALLFPEQQRQNNPNGCFNWFSPEDSRRDRGEALSIRQMIDAMIERYGIDPERIFVTGLSAGGAMASVMLATYPEVFAGGAIIAGLPYGCAKTVPQALDRMRGHGMPDEAELSARVCDASAHQGPWPSISVWQGSGDLTVSPVNADAIVGQWRSLHGVAADPSRTEIVDGYPRRVWCDTSGREVIEEYRITGMGHGTPLDTGCADGCGASGAFMLEASISSTQHICRFWGLLQGGPAEQRIASNSKLSRHEPAPAKHSVHDAAPPPGRLHVSAPMGVGKVIEDALRAAGLMR